MVGDMIKEKERGNGELDKSWLFPTAWDPNDKCSLLDLAQDSFQVDYNGNRLEMRTNIDTKE
jgi:hypothetical protein